MLTLYYSNIGNKYRKKLYSAFSRDIGSKKNSLLLVPEQFTVHAEKEIYSLSGSFAGNCEVVSFRRLCYRILFAAGRLHSSRLDKAGKAAVLHRVLNDLKDDFEYFNGVKISSAFISSLMDFLDELSRCEVSALQLIEAGRKMKKGRTRDKLNEIGLILSAYEGMLREIGESVDSEITSAKKALDDTDVFNGFNIYIDGFYSFSPEEYSLISRLMSRCDITVSLFTPDLKDKDGGYGLFSDVKATAYTLKMMADNKGVKVIEDKSDDESYYSSDVLKHIANSAFQSKTKYDGDLTGLTVYRAPDAYGEAVYAASRIKELVRKDGMSYDDFAVLVRDENNYKGVIDSVFSLYGIPVFADKRTPLSVKPPVLFIKTALQIAAGRFTADDILLYAKTGLTDVEPEMLAKIQRYCNIWNVGASQWFSGDFDSNPNGFSSEKTESDKALLDQINKSKDIIVAPLKTLRENLKGSCRDMCRAVTDFVKEINLPDKLKSQAEKLKAMGEYELCQESEQSYDTFMRAVEQIYLASDDREVTVAYFTDLLLNCLSFYDIGRIPTSLDEVIFGTPDRLKTMGKKCVFLLGMNDGEFPKNIPDNGLVNDSDRISLSRLGVELDSIADEKMFKERFYAYCALTLPSKYLYITSAAMNSEKQAISPSYYIDMLTELTGAPVQFEDSAPIQDKSLLFSMLIKGGLKDKKLLSYFENDPHYADVIEKAREFSNFGKDETALSQKLNERLSGKGLSASPTRLESYFSCRFMHFCKYVLGIRADRKAEINSSEVGNFIHSGLETILRDFAASGIDFYNTPREEIEKKIDEMTRVYLEGYLGGSEGKSERFLALFNRLKNCLCSLVLRLCDEFSTCSFKTVDWELGIGDNGPIPSKEVVFDGGSIRISGKADRVDMYSDGEKSYVRVVDYKTGHKDFSMNDIYNGINLQMFLYLFSICQNGADYYGVSPTPAGVLYYPADERVPTVNRGATSTDIEKEKEKLRRQKGLLLNDIKIIEAMDSTVSGKFIPATLKKDGSLTKSDKLITLHGFEAIERHIEKIIKEIGEEMIKGNVTPNPFKTTTANSCRYCDYAPICGYEPIRGGRQYKDYKSSELYAEVNADE